MIRRPRQKNEQHLDFIRSLPCVGCRDNTSTEAAHIRFARPALGKRYVGKSEKPDDIWTIPLCGSCHRLQHLVGESAYWTMKDRDPIPVALALWAHTGQHEVGEEIVRGNR